MSTDLSIRRAHGGFTLIEMIVVIVITGILSTIVAVFVKQSVDSYVDATRRAELTDAADVSVRQMAREIRQALPNSLRVVCPATGNPGAGSCFVEFIVTSDGGRYRDTGDGSTAGLPLVFNDSTACATTPNNCKFDVLGPPPTLAAGASGDYVVVYNLGSGYAPVDAYQLSGCAAAPGCNIAQVSAVAGNTLTLAGNPFAAQSPPLPSPNSRFQVVPFAARAVTYACPTAVPGAVVRYAGYGIHAAQGVPPAGGSPATLLTNATCAVDYTPNVFLRNGLLYIAFTIRDSAASEAVTVFQQIHVDNTP
ncbi:MAG: type II secretion system protein [Rhodocyclaceae bacterium]|nr:type II secretion system protein [Rhodocyclaceae bacterium]